MNGKNPQRVFGLMLVVFLLAGCDGAATPPTANSPLTLEYAPGKSGPTQKVDFFMSDKDQHDTLTYMEIDGLAIFEGDIILGRSTDLGTERPRTSVPQCVGDVCSSTYGLSLRFGESYLWPGGVIPFEVAPGFGAQERAEISAGISILNGATNLLVQPHNGERDYIVFVPSQGCSSSVGRQTGPQRVYLMDGGCPARTVEGQIAA